MCQSIQPTCQTVSNCLVTWKNWLNQDITTEFSAEGARDTSFPWFLQCFCAVTHWDMDCRLRITKPRASPVQHPQFKTRLQKIYKILGSVITQLVKRQLKLYRFNELLLIHTEPNNQTCPWTVILNPGLALTHQQENMTVNYLANRTQNQYQINIFTSALQEIIY